MKSVSKLVNALKFMCEVLGKKEVPLYWVILILLVYNAGERGTTTKEASEAINMTQGIASRTVKILSRYVNPVSNQLAGFDILVALRNDLHHRHRQRIYLTDHGKQVVAELLRVMEK